MHEQLRSATWLCLAVLVLSCAGEPTNEPFLEPGPQDQASAQDSGAMQPSSDGSVTVSDDAGIISVDAGPEAFDAGAPSADAGLLTEWPNAVSRTNSDAWLRMNHDALTVMRPKVLVVDAIRTDDKGAVGADIATFVPRLVSAFAEMTRPHGLRTGAPAFLQYQVAKVVDLKDPTAQYPAFWPQASDKGFDVGELFTDAFAPRFGFVDPTSPGRFLNLCDLFERGEINELWIAAEAGKRNIYEHQSRLQKYDANFNPIAGQFNNCTNGCFYDPQKRVNCKVSVRMQEINKWRGVGCGIHAAGHAIENLRFSVPYLSRANRFMNFEIGGLSSKSQYQCPYDSKSCFAFSKPDTITQGSDARIAPFSSEWGQGCGNVHFPPNGTFQYNYSNPTPALSSCDGFGLGGGPNGSDVAAPYTAQLVADFEKKFGDCGGGWVTYWGQSMPGAQNLALDADKKPMKNWWPFLFY